MSAKALLRLAGHCGAALVLSVSAIAAADDEKPSSTAAKVVTGPPARAKKPVVPSEPTADVALHVTPGGLGSPWTFEVTNHDTTPLRVVTDGRLLTLDVTPPPDDDGPHKRVGPTVHCALPAEVRPTSDTDGARVLVPDQTYVEEFDPRLFCFDGAGAAALVPDARVVARLGWAASGPVSAPSPPLVADELFGGEHRRGVKAIVAEPVVVPDTFPDEPDDDRSYRLYVTVPSRIDAEAREDVSMDVTAENLTKRPLRMMLRPETLVFDVESTHGVWSCGWHTHPGAPIAEVLTTIPPGGKASTSVLLASVCPDAAFARRGLYTVHTRIDTRQASGKSIGIDTFDGVVPATAPTLIRVRHTHQQHR